MKQVVRGLGALLAGAIILRVSAQLIAPAIPLLTVLFVTALTASWVFKRRP